MNRIRELRKQMNMTQKELTTHLQIADSTLSYWEMGKYEPDNEALMKLSKFFKVPIDYNLGGEFIRRDMSKEYKLYPGISGTQLLDSNMFVAESETVYSTSNSSDVQSFFSRIEFEGLTQGEIDILADYAAFIKSRRKSENN